jgi:hypothetical protein
VRFIDWHVVSFPGRKHACRRGPHNGSRASLLEASNMSQIIWRRTVDSLLRVMLAMTPAAAN